jgi:hypothetical protein
MSSAVNSVSIRVIKICTDLFREPVAMLSALSLDEGSLPSRYELAAVARHMKKKCQSPVLLPVSNYCQLASSYNLHTVSKIFKTLFLLPLPIHTENISNLNHSVCILDAVSHLEPSFFECLTHQCMTFIR